MERRPVGKLIPAIVAIVVLVSQHLSAPPSFTTKEAKPEFIASPGIVVVVSNSAADIVLKHIQKVPNPTSAAAAVLVVAAIAESRTVLCAHAAAPAHSGCGVSAAEQRAHELVWCEPQRSPVPARRPVRFPPMKVPFG